ncbi:hypothetical protein AB0D10_02610 [Kitasatospora sp. NPDC048545]|uniref:protein kinase domain-containing protein n=1 Tax=Kitasatospora sp. NPDC048545 TaxID=3157208 RepID=UPI0033FC761E
MADGVPTGSEPRTRVDRRPWGRPEDAPTGGPPSRLKRFRAHPDAPTRVVPPPRDATPSTVTRRPAPARGGHFGGAFPAALLNRYEPYEVAGSGTEGTVWHVRRTDGGGDAAVKVARAGQAMDAELLRHLRTEAYRRHVPEIIDFGRVEHAGTECAWVAMEYLPVTLADHIAALHREGRHTDPRETDRIIRELVAMLDFWQRRIQRNPVDFKPSNVLVRPGGGPGEFVISDFGGVARLTASRSFSPEMQVTIAYMAPEQLAGANHPAGPWWGLGNVLYELFSGRPHYLDAEGLLVSDEVLQYDLVFGEQADLSAVTDPRRLMLLQGLLTRNPAHRWKAEQVTGWLEGASPAVVRPQGSAAGAVGGYAHRPVTFLGDPYHAPSVLAWTMLNRSGEAAEWLVDGGAQQLLAWLRDEVRDTLFDLHYLRAVDIARGTRRADAAALAVLAFGAAFAPSATPVHRERPIDSAGLTRIAAAPDAVAVIDELLAASVHTVAARYDCDHPECHGEHCGRLLALARVPEVVADTDRAARELGGGRRTGDGLSVEERAESYRLAVWLTVQPEEHTRLLGRLSPLPTALHRLLLPVRVSAVLALVAAVVADVALVAWAWARAATGRGTADGVRRRWSALRRRAVRATPGTVAGCATLVAAEALRTRCAAVAEDAPGRTDGRDGPGPAARRLRAYLAPRARIWWANARTALPRQAAAALLVLVGLALVLWAGALARISVDAGNALAVLPNGAFGDRLRTAGELAARSVAPQLGAAAAAAVILVVFPARVGRGTLALAAAAAGAIGYLRLGPPMTVLKPPPAVVDRVVVFEGGMGSWAGVAAAVGVVVAVVLTERAARLTGTVHEARIRTAEQWRRLTRPAGAGAGAAGGRAGETGRGGTGRSGSGRNATDRNATGRSGTGQGGSSRSGSAPVARAWSPGSAGTRERVRFALGCTFVLVVLLGATVEVRLAATGHHPTPESWGTGLVGADYQTGFTVLLAAVSFAGTLAGPRTARRLFTLWLLGTMLLGALPPPLGPMEALRIPVAGPLYRGIAGFWGHSAFWAAVLIALPLVCLGVQRTVLRAGR